MVNAREYVESLGLALRCYAAPVFLAAGLAFGGQAIGDYSKEIKIQNESIMSSQKDKIEDNLRFCTGMALVCSGIGLSALVAPSLPKLIDELSGRV
ncbi:MAG: hypothetical protein WCP89_02275 [archaeon]